MSYFKLLHNKYKKETLSLKEVAQELGLNTRTVQEKFNNHNLQIDRTAKEKLGHYYSLNSLSEYLEEIENLVA